jgi:hypothetical protein
MHPSHPSYKNLLKAQAAKNDTRNHPILVDEDRRITCGNYTIEPWHSHEGLVRSYSIYNRFNSMYDCKDGFKSVEDAAAYINKAGA